MLYGVSMTLVIQCIDSGYPTLPRTVRDLIDQLLNEELMNDVSILQKLEIAVPKAYDEPDRAGASASGISDASAILGGNYTFVPVSGGSDWVSLPNGGHESIRPGRRSDNSDWVYTVEYDHVTYTGRVYLNMVFSA